ncbi:MAG: hypothetical protein ACRDYB_08580 [Acidimicrobiales bacterium]
MGMADRFSEPSRRREDLTFSHHKEVVSLPPKQAAKRRFGELMAATERNKGAAQTRSQSGTALPILKELGITKNQSSRAQQAVAQRLGVSVAIGNFPRVAKTNVPRMASKSFPLAAK